MTALPPIEKGIPIPSRPPGGEWGALLRRMKVGDSIKVTTNSQRNTVVQAAARCGISIKTHKLNGEGYRIWKLGTIE